MTGLDRAILALDRHGFDIGEHRVSLWSVLVLAAVVVTVILVARLGTLFTRRLFGRVQRFDATQRVLGEKIASIAIWTLAVMIGIDLLGLDLTALTVFSGALGLAIGFGLQKTLGNLIAGIILLMDRSIKPGDVIALKDGNSQAIGQVSRIGIRAVSVSTRDGKEFLIPNEILMTTQVENWSHTSREVQLRVPVTLGYRCAPDLAQRVMLEAVRATPRVLASPPPAVLIADFAEPGIRYDIAVWIGDPEEGLGNVRSAVLERVWRAFRDHGIELAGPAPVGAPPAGEDKLAAQRG